MPENKALELLLAKNLTIAVAESCTGGLLAKRLTDSPGASAVFIGGVVAYANKAKTILLGVPADLITEFGAVSEPTAKAMADGVRLRLSADVGVGITGVAGPDGGSAEKPVGTVYIAVASPDGTVVHRVQLGIERGCVREKAADHALDMVCCMLDPDSG